MILLPPSMCFHHRNVEVKSLVQQKCLGEKMATNHRLSAPFLAVTLTSYRLGSTNGDGYHERPVVTTR